MATSSGSPEVGNCIIYHQIGHSARHSTCFFAVLCFTIFTVWQARIAPVRAISLTLKSLASNKRKSAGTTSPVPKTTLVVGEVRSVHPNDLSWFAQWGSILYEKTGEWRHLDDAISVHLHPSPSGPPMSFVDGCHIKASCDVSCHNGGHGHLNFLAITQHLRKQWSKKTQKHQEIYIYTVYIYIYILYVCVLTCSEYAFLLQYFVVSPHKLRIQRFKRQELDCKCSRRKLIALWEPDIDVCLGHLGQPWNTLPLEMSSALATI